MSNRYQDLMPGNEDIKEDLTGEKTQAQKDEEAQDKLEGVEEDVTEEESEEEREEKALEEEAEADKEAEEKAEEEETQTSGDTDEEEEQEAEPDEESAEPDENDEKEEKEEIDTTVRDESDISDSFDHLAKTEEEIENADETMTALKEAGEELEEVQGTLEAFRDKPSELTGLARKMLDQKLRHCGRRLGCDYRVASTENFEGDKYDDSVFVDSLESAVADTIKRIVKVIKEWIRKAVDMGRKLWKHANDVGRKINARMKAIKDKLRKNRHGDDDLARLAEIAATSTKVENWAVADGASLVIKENHSDVLRTRVDKFKAMLAQDIKASQGFTQDIASNLELTQLATSRPDYNDVVKRTSAEYFDNVVESFGRGGAADILPGGYRLKLAGTENTARARVIAEKNQTLKVPSKEQFKEQLQAFASNGANLDKLASLVESSTASGGLLSKDFERYTEKFYKDLNAAADNIVRQYSRPDPDEDDTKSAKALNKNPALSMMQVAVSLGFSASVASRTVWLRAMHAASNALAVFAAEKRAKEDAEPAAA